MFQTSETDSSKRISPIILFFAISQLLFVSLLVWSIFSLQQEDKITDREDEPKVSISNLASAIENFPNSYIDDIEHSLTETIELNIDNFSIPDAKSTIRNDSLKVQNFDNHGFRALSMIVDIPNLQQSYQIFYKYPIDYTKATNVPYYNNPRAVLCLSEEIEKIYPNFICQAKYPQETRYKIVADYLKYFDFNYFSASINSDNPAKVYINPTKYSLTDNEKNTYLQEIKDAIESLGISSDLFEYEFIQPANLNYHIPPEDR